MKQAFKLKGLDCAYCATKIQDKVQRLKGVDSASVNFLTGKMVIECAEGEMDSILAAAEKIIKKLEPDVVVQKTPRS